MLIISICMLYLNLSIAVCQDFDYAKKIIKTLSSPKFHGRGYVNDGLALSANYINNEFKINNLIPLFADYSQYFYIPVNTFPGNMSVFLDDSLLTPGKDFLVEPFSPGLTGKYTVVVINKKEILDERVMLKRIKKATGKILILDNRNINELDEPSRNKNTEIVKILQYSPKVSIAGLIEIIDKKLTWNISAFESNRPSLALKGNWDIKKIKSVTLDIENQYYESYKVKNIAGYVKGELQPDSFIVFSSHYDHLGQMGRDTYFPGANDNASGVAMMLTLAKYFSEYPPNYSLLFISFAGEEAGLIGSKYFVEHSPINLGKIKFLINLDLVGGGEEGITVVNGSVYKKEFQQLKDINNKQNLLPGIKSRDEACNSDHCFFYKTGVPCFFIYTIGGGKAYHDLDDTYENLSLVEFMDLTKLLIEFTKSF